MEIILNITLFCLAVTVFMLLYIGYQVVIHLYQQHKIDKINDRYERMREDGSIDLPDDWSND